MSATASLSALILPELVQHNTVLVRSRLLNQQVSAHFILNNAFPRGLQKFAYVRFGF
jgi:hypothetical protein